MANFLKTSVFSSITLSFLSLPAVSESYPKCDSSLLTSQTIPEKPFEYEVLRKGKKIGSHTISFKETDEGLRVRAHTKMKVKLLFVTVYKYEYIGDDVWCDGEIVRVESNINDNGEKWSINATLRDDQYVVESDEGTSVLPAGSVPTNHWNMDVVNTDKLFNTITGKVDEITVNPVGSHTVPSGDSEKDVTRYKVRGDLNIDTFYDASGNWSGMQFEHNDGSDIQFVCIRCTT